MEVFVFHTTIDVPYRVQRDGWYNVAIEFCDGTDKQNENLENKFQNNRPKLIDAVNADDDYSNVGDGNPYSYISIGGAISFKNPYGYLPAGLFGVLPYQVWLNGCLLYTNI
jgi:hypothetical protein